VFSERTSTASHFKKRKYEKKILRMLRESKGFEPDKDWGGWSRRYVCRRGEGGENIFMQGGVKEAQKAICSKKFVSTDERNIKGWDAG